MNEIYIRLFPAVLKLACDIEQVIIQFVNLLLSLLLLLSSLLLLLFLLLFIDI